MTTPQTISKSSIMRLIRDVKDIISTPLTEHGIHYKHSDEDVLKGQALIIGPKETPYENGFYLFDITYPNDYPHRPPLVTFRTNDGKTRMNPNLYKCGKVCVSILNTWKGDAWTGCQTISTMLLALVSLLNSNPLLNEPGVPETSPDCLVYRQIVAYKNVEIAMKMVLESKTIRNHFSSFVETMENVFIESFSNTVVALKKASNEVENDTLTTHVYRLNLTPNYNSLIKDLTNLYNKISNKITKLK